MHNEVTTQPAIGLPLYRLVNGRLVRDDLRGDLVLLKDARYALNSMRSVIESTEVGGLGQSHALVKAHKERGDMLRIWAIVGDVNAGNGMKQDIFERLTHIMELVAAQAREIERLKALLQVHTIVTEHMTKGLAPLITLTKEEIERQHPKEAPKKLGWTQKEMMEDVLVGRVFMRVTQASRPTEIRVTREELEACRALIQRECPPLLMSARKYTLFHNVELIPE